MKPMDDPYVFLRRRAAQLLDEGCTREARRLLKAMDSMWYAELKQSGAVPQKQAK